jgi:hypothetical protein
MKKEIAGFIFKDRNFENFQSFLNNVKTDVIKIAQKECDKTVIFMATFLHDCDVVNYKTGIKNYYNYVLDSLVHELEESSINPSQRHPLNHGFIIYYKLFDFGYLCNIKAVANERILDYVFNIKNENLEWCNYSESLLESPDFQEKNKMLESKKIWEESLKNTVEEEFSSFIVAMPNKIYISSDENLQTLIPTFEERLNILARDIDIQTYIDNNKLENTDNKIFMYAASVDHKNRVEGLKAKFKPMLENSVITIERLKKDNHD